MQNLKPTPVFLLLLFFLFSACGREREKPVSREGYSAVAVSFLEKAKEVKDPREKVENLNLALTAVTSAKDTILTDLLDFKIYYHNVLKEYDSSLYYADSLVKVAALQQDTSQLAKGFYRKAKVFSYLDDQEGVFSNNFEARRYYLAIKDSSQAGRRTLEMAIAQSRSGDLTGSQETATEGLRLLNRNTDSTYLSSIHNAIAIVYHEQELYEDAAAEYRNALAWVSSTADSLSILNNLALVLKDRKNYSEAIAIWKDLLKKTDSESKKARYSDNLSYTVWLQDPSQSVGDDLLSALGLRREIGDREGMLASYNHLSEYHKGRNPEFSLKYTEQLYDLSRELGNTNTELQSLKKLIPKASLPQARIYSERYLLLNDSIQMAALKAKNAFAKIRYDEERKQQEISGLKTTNALQALETQRLRNRALTGSFIGSLLLLCTFFLLYHFRQRHKREKIREVHKTESRISKVIHDELANDIFNVMSSLEQLVPVPVIDKLENIYLRTRDISRENNDIETGPDFSDNLIATLSNITPVQTRLIIRGEKNVQWEKLREEKKIVIYRVLQELLINMKKYSGATLVAIIFSENHKSLEINYSDNGEGMDWNPSIKGGGLQNVENRIFSVNGSITFESYKGKGFKASIRIPL